MESENSDDKISTLLAQTSSCPKNADDNKKNNTSNNSDSQNTKKLKESTIDEKYFYLKLKKLLSVPKEFSFSNVNIILDDFLKDIQSFLKWVINKKGITEEKASEIMAGIKKDLIGIGKIEFDSLFAGVSGEIVSEFFRNMKKYSFPNSEKNPILKNENYTIIVESMHNLNIRRNY